MGKPTPHSHKILLFSSKTRSIYMHHKILGSSSSSLTPVIQEVEESGLYNPSEETQNAPNPYHHRRVMKTSLDNTLIFAKIQSNKLIVIDSDDPTNRVFLMIESTMDSASTEFQQNLEIIYFEALRDKQFLILTSDAILHIFSYEGLRIKEEKVSDALGLKGEITAACFDHKLGILAVNQLRKIGHKNWQNIIQLFSVNLNNWNWVEKTSEVSSGIHQSKEISHFRNS